MHMGPYNYPHPYRVAPGLTHPVLPFARDLGDAGVTNPDRPYLGPTSHASRGFILCASEKAATLHSGAEYPGVDVYVYPQHRACQMSLVPCKQLLPFFSKRRNDLATGQCVTAAGYDGLAMHCMCASDAYMYMYMYITPKLQH